jgi:hypothetical protein
MRIRSVHLLAVLVPLSLTLGACDEGTPTEPDPETQPLDAEERAGLVEAVLALGMAPEVPAPASAAAPAGPSLAPVTISIPVEQSFDCPLGGSLSVTGGIDVVVDDETGVGSYDHELRKTHESCRVVAPRLEREFLLEGAPSVTTRASARLESEALVSIEGSEQGSVAWQLDDRSGTCTIDVTYTVTGPAGGTPSYQATGTVCGSAVEVELQPED